LNLYVLWVGTRKSPI